MGCFSRWRRGSTAWFRPASLLRLATHAALPQRRPASRVWIVSTKVSMPSGTGGLLGTAIAGLVFSGQNRMRRTRLYGRRLPAMARPPICGACTATRQKRSMSRRRFGGGRGAGSGSTSPRSSLARIEESARGFRLLPFLARFSTSRSGRGRTSSIACLSGPKNSISSTSMRLRRYLPAPAGTVAVAGFGAPSPSTSPTPHSLALASRSVSVATSVPRVLPPPR